MDEKVKKTAELVREELEGEGTGHDWWHVYRVWQNARHIGKAEGADMFVVELAALLHDIADYKFHGGDEEVGPRKAGEWLESLNVEKGIITHIQEIIKTLSFKGSGVDDMMKTLEGEVVQDADRLDALGAIGIARCFATGNHFNQEIHNPELPPRDHKSKFEYKESHGKTTSINHFYEKLLLLKDRMKTRTGRKMAQKRHEFMEEYLQRFYKEWNGEL